MAHRSNHYERAFEEFLRARGLPYVAVDERRRSLLGATTLKNADFLVSGTGGGRWVVDVKGRRFGGPRGAAWKNWCTADDLSGLAAWETMFGPRFRSLLVFAYLVVGRQSPLPESQLYQFGGRRYAFVGVPRDEYHALARPISRRWNTYAMRAADFRAWAAPVEHFFGGADSPRCGGEALTTGADCGDARESQ